MSGSDLKTDLSLNSVENTALSTWAGTSNITTLGTIGTGTWQGTAIASAYLDADTAHLSATQTFTGAKTFSNAALTQSASSAVTTIKDTNGTGSATTGGHLKLIMDDGATTASGHRLGVIEFQGAEDSSNTITTGARIEAVTDATWSASENGASLKM